MKESVIEAAAREPERGPVIQSGTCYAIFAYDVAHSVNLDAADRRILESTQRETIKHRRRAPSYFEYQPPPLRITQETESLAIGRFRCRPSVDLVVYDFGAVAVIYALSLAGRFADLLDVSTELYDNDVLLADSRGRVSRLVNELGTAATKASLTPIVEDYLVFHIESFATQIELPLFCAENRSRIAQILRAERQDLSDEETEDAVAARIAFGTDDLTIVDWNAALVVDRAGDDVRAVLEFANVELLEMRYLDQKLDSALDAAYETLSKRFWSLPRLAGYSGSDLRRVAELQVDNAVLFEGVNNTLKLLGDQYLARLYRLINRRFHLGEWDASILRKLETLESIYEKISDQAATRRMEILEWVIIILIAFSIALEFIPHG
jgi:hypothetical protein